MTIVLLSGFLLGFLGSLHCVGMCGPIVLALPFRSPVRWRFIAKRVLYHLGRISVYTLFGLAFGFLGDRVQFTNLQHTISIVAGVFILLIGLSSLFHLQFLTKLSFIEKPYVWMKALLGKYITGDGLPSGFLLGVLNGFLPCGFVYIAIAGSLLYHDPLQSSLFMTTFGSGTIPALILVSILPGLFGNKIKFNVRKLIPVITIVMAIIFIIRGLNLGIPYLSPNIEKKVFQKTEQPATKAEQTSSEKKDCCE